MAELDFSDSLNQISCPALVVCGEKDKANKKASIELADILKCSQFKEISETGHEVNLESPEKLASLLREFYISIWQLPVYKAQEAVAQGKNPSAAASLRLNASRSTKTLAIDPLISKKQITQSGPSE